MNVKRPVTPEIIIGDQPSEEDLLDLARRAHEAGLPYYLVTDSGRTEFHGVPTNTALGVGPAWGSELQPITGHLPLY